MKTTNEHISTIIKNSFDVLQHAYENHIEGKQGTTDVNRSRIIFPQYRKKGEIRLSEQELRFVFVEQFNKYCDKEKLEWYYSIETPTKNGYIFSDKEDKISEPEVNNDKGRSAMFDLVVYDKDFNRIALIEFKAKNPSKKEFNKDLLKLEKEGEENILTYFIMYVESYNRGTNKSLAEKLEYKDKHTKVYCYSLNDKTYLIKPENN